MFGAGNIYPVCPTYDYSRAIQCEFLPPIRTEINAIIQQNLYRNPR